MYLYTIPFTDKAKQQLNTIITSVNKNHHFNDPWAHFDQWNKFSQNKDNLASQADDSTRQIVLYFLGASPEEVEPKSTESIESKINQNKVPGLFHTWSKVRDGNRFHAPITLDSHPIGAFFIPSFSANEILQKIKDARMSMRCNRNEYTKKHQLQKEIQQLTNDLLKGIGVAQPLQEKKLKQSPSLLFLTLNFFVPRFIKCMWKNHQFYRSRSVVALQKALTEKKLEDMLGKLATNYMKKPPFYYRYKNIISLLNYGTITAVCYFLPQYLPHTLLTLAFMLQFFVLIDSWHTFVPLRQSKIQKHFQKTVQTCIHRLKYLNQKNQMILPSFVFSCLITFFTLKSSLNIFLYAPILLLTALTFENILQQLFFQKEPQAETFETKDTSDSTSRIERPTSPLHLRTTSLTGEMGLATLPKNPQKK